MNSEQRERLFGNIARHMQAGNTSQEIRVRQICHFFRADPAYGIGVARALGIDLEEFIPNEAGQPKASSKTLGTSQSGLDRDIALLALTIRRDAGFNYYGKFSNGLHWKRA